MISDLTYIKFVSEAETKIKEWTLKHHINVKDLTCLSYSWEGEEGEREYALFIASNFEGNFIIEKYMGTLSIKVKEALS